MVFLEIESLNSLELCLLMSWLLQNNDLKRANAILNKVIIIHKVKGNIVTKWFTITYYR